jgi:hypothetical protein
MITPADFIGKWQISKGFGSNKLQTYIDEQTPKLLAELFGVDMYQEWVNDSTLFPELFVPFQYQLPCGEIVTSLGVETMLKNIIYATYDRNDHVTATSGGAVVLQPEGGQVLTDNNAVFIRYYNEGVATHEAIQERIKANKEDYPLFKGIEKQRTWHY